MNAITRNIAPFLLFVSVNAAYGVDPPSDMPVADAGVSAAVRASGGSVRSLSVSAGSLALEVYLGHCRVERQLAVDLGRLKGIRTLDLSSSNIDDETFNALTAGDEIRSSLGSLTLSRTRLGREGLAYISRLTNIERLVLPAVTTDAGLEPLSSLAQLQDLDLTGARITDRAMVAVARLSSLRRLNLSETQISGVGLRELRHLAGLRKLELGCNTKLTDSDIIALEGIPNLDDLSILAPLTDVGLAHLGKLSSLARLQFRAADDLAFKASSVRSLDALEHLKAVDISGPSVSDDEVRGILKITSLEDLSISGRTTDAAFTELRGLKSLTRLSLAFARISNSTFSQIADLKSLNALDLSETRIGDADFDRLVTNAAFADGLVSLGLSNTRLSNRSLSSVGRLSRLRFLVLPGATSDAGINDVARLNGLEELDASRTEITDVSITVLLTLPKLRKLDLSQTQVTDNAVPALSKMTGLEELRLTETPMTITAIDRLRESLKNTRVVSSE